MDKTALINRALRFLGERPITSADTPETSAGKHLASIYDQCRKEVIEVFPWNFAETWAEVDKVNAPPFGYPDAYGLPTDFIRLLIVGNPTNETFSGGGGFTATQFDQSRLDFRLLYQGAPDFRRAIAIDNGGAAKLKLAYSADITLLHLWSPLALKVFALWMALDASRSITGQTDLSSEINMLLTEALRDAAGVDGSQQMVRLRHDSPTRNARMYAQYDSNWFTPVDFTP